MLVNERPVTTDNSNTKNLNEHNRTYKASVILKKKKHPEIWI